MLKQWLVIYLLFTLAVPGTAFADETITFGTSHNDTVAYAAGQAMSFSVTGSECSVGSGHIYISSASGALTYQIVDDASGHPSTTTTPYITGSVAAAGGYQNWSTGNLTSALSSGHTYWLTLKSSGALTTAINNASGVVELYLPPWDGGENAGTATWDATLGLLTTGCSSIPTTTPSTATSTGITCGLSSTTPCTIPTYYDWLIVNLWIIFLLALLVLPTIIPSMKRNVAHWST